MNGTRPLMLGYLRVDLLHTPVELMDARESLANFAYAEGYTLGTVFTENARTAPAAFHALIASVRHEEARVVVVPSAQHLDTRAALRSLREQLENHTGATVLVAQSPP